MELIHPKRKWMQPESCRPLVWQALKRINSVISLTERIAQSMSKV